MRVVQSEASMLKRTRWSIRCAGMRVMQSEGKHVKAHKMKRVQINSFTKSLKNKTKVSVSNISTHTHFLRQKIKYKFPCVRHLGKCYFNASGFPVIFKQKTKDYRVHSEPTEWCCAQKKWENIHINLIFSMPSRSDQDWQSQGRISGLVVRNCRTRLHSVSRTPLASFLCPCCTWGGVGGGGQIQKLRHSIKGTAYRSRTTTHKQTPFTYKTDKVSNHPRHELKDKNPETGRQTITHQMRLLQS